MTSTPDTPRLELWWLPVGAGGHLVVHTSRWWEVLQAWREHREPRPLYHSALEATVDGSRYVIEMTPAWGQPSEAHGVLVTGPVGLSWLGRSRWFRYVVRAWPDGVLPDRAFAVGSPVVIPLDSTGIRALLGVLSEVPPLTWGRQVPATHDMWNSNSVVSWALTRCGVDAAAIAPPDGGEAPGWAAGIALARIAAN